MLIDIEKTIREMINVGTGVLLKEGEQVNECVKKAFLDEREALKDIAEARIKGEINDEDMKSQLEDEKETLEASLLACQVKAKAAAQKAVNAALDVFKDAVITVIRGGRS